MVAVDPPLVGDSTDDVQSVVPGGIDHSLVPGAAVVLDFDPGVTVLTDDGSDGEGTAGQARVAVQGSVGGEFRGAEDHIVCSWAGLKNWAQVGAYGADVLGAAGIGDA